MTLTAETASEFYYWFEPSYFMKYVTDLRQFTTLLALFVYRDGCCEMWLRSLKGRCHGNRFSLLNLHNFLSPQ